ncbi:MAG: proprotein convertase P-domain-containing protein, partial [Gammaproteobacteria bacterium]|nr:proprotein convertase P-domain-containing protein [Gammaproteobacteria bacterium]
AAIFLAGPAGVNSAFARPPEYMGPADAGRYDPELLYYVDIFPKIACDGDGTRCGNTNLIEIQRTLDGTNGLHYRSDSRIRFRISDDEFLSSPIHSDIFNNTCLPASWVTVDTVQIPDGTGGTEAVQILKDGNGNVIDTPDYLKEDLCVPVDKSLVSDTGLYVQGLYGAVLVVVYDGYRKVKWDGVNDFWRIYRSTGGDSGCESYYINMPRTLGSANLFSHEAGHYFCSPHPFVTDRDSEQIIINEIQAHVNGGFAQPWETQKIVDDLYNRDDEVSYSGIAGYLNHPFYAVTDTPADVAAAIFEEQYGSDAGCAYSPDFVNIAVSFGGYQNPFVYTIRPDRRNIMSYFKGCFPQDASFSYKQVVRAEVAASFHRDPVTRHLMIDTWINDADKGISVAGYGDEKWVASYIRVEDDERPLPIRRAIVGVDIKHPRGGLFIHVVSPDGQVFQLHSPANNENQISGDVKDLFTIENTGSLRKNGLWKLLVAEQSRPTISDKSVVKDLAAKLQLDQDLDLAQSSDSLSNANVKNLKYGKVKLDRAITDLSFAARDEDDSTINLIDSNNPLPLFQVVEGKIDDWQIQFEY